MIPYVTVIDSINGNSLTLTLSWEEPFNNLNPIVNYTVSCSGDVTCPPNFTATHNIARITNLISNAHYVFSVVATNSIGSGEAGVVTIDSPPTTTVTTTAPTTVASSVDTTTVTSIESTSSSISIPITTASSSIETTTVLNTSMITTTSS